MTLKEAYQILGLPPGTKLSDVKKTYRNLMMQVHPDMSAHTERQLPHASAQSCLSGFSAYRYSAQEINTAYSLIKDRLSAKSKTAADPTRRTGSSGNHSAKKQFTAWNAPVNDTAYTEREILQYAEDSGGSAIGHFCIARGKYMWTIDEDFSLFLLSLYQCSKQILDEIDTRLNREDTPADRPSFQAELTYLLAQQFISQTALLKELAKEETCSDGQSVFYIPSMLETSGRNSALKPGDALYPSVIRQHRLYLKDLTGQETGYLSFSDDRLYYIVVPLFEQRAVQIKINIAEKQPERKKTRYQNLHVWLKPIISPDGQLPENLNLQIEQLLKSYR